MAKKKRLLYKKYFTKEQLALWAGFYNLEAFLMSKYHEQFMDLAENVLEYIDNKYALSKEDTREVMKDVIDQILQGKRPKLK